MTDFDRQAYDRARRSRDDRFDGRFFIAVTTTRIYCRPICPAPSPKDEHVRYFGTADEAEAAGYRACLRCRPEASPGTPAWSGTASIVTRALRLIHAGALDEGSVEQLAERVGVTGRHLRRLFRQHLGTTPLRIAITHRARRREAVKRYRVELPYRPPYDWDAVLGFLRGRATPGVEAVDGSHYRRTIALDGECGFFDVSPIDSRAAIALDVHISDPRQLLTVVDRVRRMFDLNADPRAIAADLGGDALLSSALARHPGIRTPGAWNGFELAVRAIIGQQVSVRAATTITGRIASLFGTAATTHAPGFGRFFPTPAQLANAAIEQAGVMSSRAAAIRTLARHVACGTLTLSPSIDPRSTIAKLKALPGIGDWTAQYVAMRALGEPDAFLSGDLIVRRAGGNCSAREMECRSLAWRPWRAYAVMLLWQHDIGGHNQVLGRSGELT